MRIKDYADSKGVTSQTIYKKMRSPKYKERLKGHLYRDNQKVENLDLIGIKILEDYAFENDVIKLEHELNKLKKTNKEEKTRHANQIDKLANKLTSSLENRNNLIQEKIRFTGLHQVFRTTEDYPTYCYHYDSTQLSNCDQLHSFLKEIVGQCEAVRPLALTKCPTRFGELQSELLLWLESCSDVATIFGATSRLQDSENALLRSKAQCVTLYMEVVPLHFTWKQCRPLKRKLIVWLLIRVAIRN